MYKTLLLFTFAAVILACAGKSTTTADGTPDGAAIFKKYCSLCHGTDGKLALNGAKDITVSTLSEAERITLVTKGKTTMTPFEGILSPEEVKAVVAYTFTLKP